MRFLYIAWGQYNGDFPLTQQPFPVPAEKWKGNILRGCHCLCSYKSCLRSGSRTLRFIILLRGSRQMTVLPCPQYAYVRTRGDLRLQMSLENARLTAIL